MHAVLASGESEEVWCGALLLPASRGDSLAATMLLRVVGGLRAVSDGGIIVATRHFGPTGWTASEIGFGAWAIGGTWGKDSEEDARAEQDCCVGRR